MLKISLKVKLFLLSFLILFLELALIRYVSANIRLTSYFSNLVLLGTFLGIGLGFLLSKKTINLFYWYPPLLLFLIILLAIFKIEVNVDSKDVIFFKNAISEGVNFFPVEPAILLPIIFFLVTAIFTPLAQGLGKLFEKFKPLEAYTIDILGSISGIVLFSILSFLQTPAYVWFLLLTIIFLVLIWGKKKLLFIISALFLLTIVLISFITNENGVWSPYYKVTWLQTGNGTQINVNNIVQQYIIDYKYKKGLFYTIPYSTLPSFMPKNILIIGAGNGIDAATALKEDGAVEHIDAVEIDPVILELGKKYNPNKPYSDPKVTTHIIDGRAFIENTDKKYDLIIYALPDSLTLMSGYSSARLESFLFTKEAFSTAKDHLTPSGMFILYNFYREEWLVDKIANTLYSVFGEKPFVNRLGKDWGGATFFEGSRIKELKGIPFVAEYKPSGKIAPSIDDWPFLYLKNRHIPLYYIKFISIIGTISLILILIVSKSNKLTFDTRLFFMGAAFMLLETKSLTTYSILFGNTWYVNSLVISAILLFILLANIVVAKFTFRSLKIFYGLLFTLLAASYFLPTSIFLHMNLYIRFATASIFYFSPIFFANIIFATLFKNSKDSSISFGSNMLGALLGGFLEYISLITGFKFLALIIIFFYILSLTKFPKIYKTK